MSFRTGIIEQVTEIDPDLSLIMYKLQQCEDQDSLKTNLMDVEGYLNAKPIEVVVTQKSQYVPEHCQKLC